jgi:hypothetical protein
VPREGGVDVGVASYGAADSEAFVEECFVGFGDLGVVDFGAIYGWHNAGYVMNIKE